MRRFVLNLSLIALREPLATYSSDNFGSLQIKRLPARRQRLEENGLHDMPSISRRA